MLSISSLSLFVSAATKSVIEIIGSILSSESNEYFITEDNLYLEVEENTEWQT
jgi:hypothetical protein